MSSGLVRVVYSSWSTPYTMIKNNFTSYGVLERVVCRKQTKGYFNLWNCKSTIWTSKYSRSRQNPVPTHGVCHIYKSTNLGRSLLRHKSQKPFTFIKILTLLWYNSVSFVTILYTGICRSTCLWRGGLTKNHVQEEYRTHKTPLLDKEIWKISGKTDSLINERRIKVVIVRRTVDQRDFK